MIYYKFSTCSIPHVKLMSEEHLYGVRPHVTRTLNETVIYILTEGSLFLESGGKTVEMYPGDVHVFSFGEFQKPLKITECKYYYLHFFDELSSISMTSEQVKEYYTASQQFFLRSNLYDKDISTDVFNKLIIPKHFNINGSPYLKQIKSCLKEGKVNRFTVKSEFYNFNSNLKAAELFYRLYLSCSEANPNNTHVFNEGTARKIIEYIDSNMEKHLTGKDLETEFGYSFDHMNRRFKTITGENIFNYLMKSRINQAKVLLYTKKISVTQVAEMTGFCNIYHFSKMFRKFTGMTPTEYVNYSKTNPSDE